MGLNPVTHSTLLSETRDTKRLSYLATFIEDILPHMAVETVTLCLISGEGEGEPVDRRRRRGPPRNKRRFGYRRGPPRNDEGGEPTKEVNTICRRIP